MKPRRGLLSRRRLAAPLMLLWAALPAALSIAAPVNAPVSGEIQFITVNDPGDRWSGGSIVVGGEIVILPRNLLIDLPANRMTLQRLFLEAPPACRTVSQSGLAKADSCNASGTGAIATIHGNRTSGGNVIAGDVYLQKGVETVTGQVTYVSYEDGYFRVNGAPGDRASGVMVRLNDPTARHTLQQGPGCAGGPNCSADPRFTLDPDNYVNAFSTGYPLCLPSTRPRTFDGTPIGLGAAATAQAQPDGSGDVLCPLANRTVNNGDPVDDSRRFAPLMVGDSVSAEGNFERVAGVQFLSAHSTTVFKALTTRNAPGQPDYLFLDEVGIDAPAFQNQRIRTLIIGYSTLSPSDVLLWTVHYDPQTHSRHEFPLASTVGCDSAAGAATCTQQGLVGAGANIFRVRYDADFLIGAKPKLNPCAHLRADARFAPLNICPSGGDAQSNLVEMMGIMSPLPREIQARTGHSLAHPGLVTLDVGGVPAPNGQYLFPLGMGLGGITFMEFKEIDLNMLQTPYSFSGMPWTLDRRLSPGGCEGACEATPQPLDPYPFEGIDPRTQVANLPAGFYADGAYTAGPLSDVRNRILSFVDPAQARTAGDGVRTPARGNFNGDVTVLAWPPADPPARAIVATPVVKPNAAPVAVADSAVTQQRTPAVVNVLANDRDADGNPLAIVAVSPATGGAVVNNRSSVTFTPAASFIGVATFSYTISDGNGGSATAPVTVTVNPAANLPPVASDDTASTAGAPVSILVLANDADPNGDVLRVVSVTNGALGRVTNNGFSVTYTPNAGAAGVDAFQYTVSDGRGGVATARVTVTIAPGEALRTSLAVFLNSTSEWRVGGASSSTGAVVTVRLGRDLSGPIIGSAVVGATGSFVVRVLNSPLRPAAGATVSLSSSAGASQLGVPVKIQ